MIGRKDQQQTCENLDLILLMIFLYHVRPNLFSTKLLTAPKHRTLTKSISQAQNIDKVNYSLSHHAFLNFDDDMQWPF